jgi:UDP-N-acetylglucosamine diphosphorylase/glucosamine-1-phosphate N-acetyltransferase
LLAIIVLAAGKGTRMKSDLPKVLHQIGGLPLIEHVLRSAQALVPDRLIIVVGHRREEVKNRIRGFGADFVVQEPQLGTGHAVQIAARELVGFDGEVVVLSGDVPLLKASTLRKLVEAHVSHHSAATVLTTHAPDPTAYGRIVRSGEGTFDKIVEEREATVKEKEISEINSGVYCFDAEPLFSALGQIKAENSKGEYYLTDVIEILKSDGGLVQAIDAADFREVRGINTVAELEEAERTLQADVDAKSY